MSDIAVILPALNEEKAIGGVISEIQTIPLDVDIYVVDNGSTDHTAQIADSLGAVVIQAPVRGKGNAIRYGINYVNHPYVFMLDSDLTYPACYIPDLLSKLQNGYDVAVGERQIKKENMTALHRIGNNALNLIANALYSRRINDLCSGMWGFHNYVLKDLSLSAPDFTLEADIYTMVNIKGYKLARVPIEYRERVGKGHLRWKDGLKIGNVLIKRCLQ